MLRRLWHDQPESFAFTAANAAWAEGQIAKYPEGRQASAVIPILWRGQEQEGWISRPMIETVAKMLGMAEIRVLEIATFYFMFQLRPVGSVAHVQVCGTTSCMICGAEDLVEVCKEKIAPSPHELSSDGRFSWEEVECLGACANAPMIQIGKDYYEDLDRESFTRLLDAFAAGEVPTPGSAKGRFSSEPLGGLTSLEGDRTHEGNGSVELALALGDTTLRIDGSERTATDLALGHAAPAIKPAAVPPPNPAKAAPQPEPSPEPQPDGRPELYESAPEDGGDDLKRIRGIGPKLEGMLHTMGVYRFAQIASWTDREVAWVDENLEGFNGRILRDDWVGQAKDLSAGETTEFAARVDKGEVESSKGSGEGEG